MPRPDRSNAWTGALLAAVLVLLPLHASGERFVLVCSLATVNANGDSLGQDQFTLHVDTERNTVDGDPAQIDAHTIRFSDPYVKGATTVIDRQSGRLKGSSATGLTATGSCKKT